MYGQQTST